MILCDRCLEEGDMNVGNLGKGCLDLCNWHMNMKGRNPKFEKENDR